MERDEEPRQQARRGRGTLAAVLVLLAAVLLYIWRHVVQDKLPMRLREQIPRTPEEEREHAELKAATTAASV